MRHRTCAASARGFTGNTAYASRLLLCTLLFLAGLPSAPLRAQAKSIPEEIEWTWEVRPPHPQAALPNVLLLGDSISRAYFPQVTGDLKDVANVYLLASSASVGDPRLTRQIQEFGTLEGIAFQVVHLNNGMHGWGYTEEQYSDGFPAFLHAATDLLAHSGKLVVATTTPVRQDAGNGADNRRVDARNEIARAQANAAHIAVDDQHALMLAHQDLHEDPVHFNARGAALQGHQAADSIRAALRKP